MSETWSPPYWTASVPFLAPLSRAAILAFESVWISVLSAKRNGRSSGDGASAGTHDTGSDQVRVNPDTLFIESAAELRVVLATAHVPMLPLDAATGSDATKMLDDWLQRVLRCDRTFTGELQTPGTLCYRQVLQIIMRARSSMLLHANGFRAPIPMHGLESATTPADGSGGVRHLLQRRKQSQNRRGSHAAHRSSSRRQSTGSTGGNDTTEVLAAHPMSDLDKDPDRWWGPAWACAARLQKSTISGMDSGSVPPSVASAIADDALLEAFGALGGNADGTGTVSLETALSLLSNAPVDTSEFRLPGAQVTTADDGTVTTHITIQDLGRLLNGGMDGGGHGAWNTVKFVAKARTMFHNVRKGGGHTLVTILNDDGSPVAAGGDGTATENDGANVAAMSASKKEASWGLSRMATTAGSDYRVTRDGRFVLQPWIKRPVRATAGFGEDDVPQSSHEASRSGLYAAQSRTEMISQSQSRSHRTLSLQPLIQRPKNADTSSIATRDGTSNASPSPDQQGRRLTRLALRAQQQRRQMRQCSSPRGKARKSLFAVHGIDKAESDDESRSGSAASSVSSTPSDRETMAEVVARYRKPNFLPPPVGRGRGPHASLPVIDPDASLTKMQKTSKYSTIASLTRKVDVNRAKAMEKHNARLLHATEEAERAEAERRRRRAAGLEDAAEPLADKSYAARGESQPISFATQKRPPSVQGTLKTAERLLQLLTQGPALSKHHIPGRAGSHTPQPQPASPFGGGVPKR